MLATKRRAAPDDLGRNHGKVWTKERNSLLLESFLAGLSLTEIKELVGTNEGGIQLELNKIAQRYGDEGRMPPEFRVNISRAGDPWEDEDIYLLHHTFSATIDHPFHEPRGFRGEADDPSYIASFLGREEEEVRKFLDKVLNRRKSFGLTLNVAGKRRDEFSRLSRYFDIDPPPAIALRIIRITQKLKGIQS